ncbi:hypothetical protein PUN71_000895 [Arthrobacter sp. NQ7]|uniref:hypothetical protein n=1 Tax=Arthrobacter sp. NQ7 TaxID=3032303 RepID=UPI0024107593|nr:hypothetical protein [Arthrobacter sp. NQ7]MDJ0455756.1 hypothetical protein [Arthrobacter sp. NQ7]
MTSRALPSLLCRAWLLAGILAVIAGLLGMHVLTAGHASHGRGSHGLDSRGLDSHSPVTHSPLPPGGGAPSGPGAVAPAGHVAVGHSARGDHADGVAMAAAATCGSPCPLAREPGAQCIPSAPSAPQTGHPPQATLAGLPALHTVTGPGSAYGYLPPSPTPCELSISRT